MRTTVTKICKWWCYAISIFIYKVLCQKSRGFKWRRRISVIILKEVCVTIIFQFSCRKNQFRSIYFASTIWGIGSRFCKKSIKTIVTWYFISSGQCGFCCSLIVSIITNYQRHNVAIYFHCASSWNKSYSNIISTIRIKPA